MYQREKEKDGERALLKVSRLGNFHFHGFRRENGEKNECEHKRNVEGNAVLEKR